MNDQEKQEYLSQIRYFYHEKGEIERFADFSIEKLEAADPILAGAYKQFIVAQATFTRLLFGTREDY